MTGASYGVGRGIAEVLGACGATVYLTGRSTRRRATLDAAWTVEETADLVTAAGGEGIPVALDHTKDSDVERLVARIRDEQGRLDLLVNNVWQWGPPETYLAPTWEQPIARWDAMFGTALRSQFAMTRFALPLMIGATRGLVLFTQERPGGSTNFGQNVVVDAAAATTQRIVRYLGRELRPRKVAVMLAYPGWVRSVNLGMGFDLARSGMSEAEFLRRTQSPYLIGRAVASLAADPRVLRKSGRTMYVGDIAREYGFTDIDGRVPSYEGGE